LLGKFGHKKGKSNGIHWILNNIVTGKELKWNSVSQYNQSNLKMLLIYKVLFWVHWYALIVVINRYYISLQYMRITFHFKKDHWRVESVNLYFCFSLYSIFKNAVKHGNKGHSCEPENVTLMSSCPLYTG
jgi:hypothetical protein